MVMRKQSPSPWQNMRTVTAPALAAAPAFEVRRFDAAGFLLDLTLADLEVFFVAMTLLPPPFSPRRRAMRRADHGRPALRSTARAARGRWWPRRIRAGGRGAT